MIDATCPYCGTLNDAATSVDGPGIDDVVPTPGAVAFCFRCGAFAIVETDRFRKPTRAELEELFADERCQRLRAAWLSQRADMN